MNDITNDLVVPQRERTLPPEIMLREKITNDGDGIIEIGGVQVVGANREIEVQNHRGDVLRRVPVTEIKDWVKQNRYRYVPRTRGNYHREVGTLE